jgi:hypothetical protein
MVLIPGTKVSGICFFILMLKKIYTNAEEKLRLKI